MVTKLIVNSNLLITKKTSGMATKLLVLLAFKLSKIEQYFDSKTQSFCQKGFTLLLFQPLVNACSKQVHIIQQRSKFEILSKCVNLNNIILR